MLVCPRSGREMSVNGQRGIMFENDPSHSSSKEEKGMTAGGHVVWKKMQNSGTTTTAPTTWDFFVDIETRCREETTAKRQKGKNWFNSICRWNSSQIALDENERGQSIICIKSVWICVGETILLPPGLSLWELLGWKLVSLLSWPPCLVFLVSQKGWILSIIQAQNQIAVSFLQRCTLTHAIF